MKPQFIAYYAILILSLGFSACSNDDYNNPGDPGEQLNNDAILYEFDNQSFENNLSLELSLPEETDDSGDTVLRLLLPFYNPTEEDADKWYPIPGVRIDKGYKIYGTYNMGPGNLDHVILKIGIEKDDSSEAYGKSLDFRQVRVVAVKPSAIINYTREELDIWDYDAVMKHFSLDTK